MRIDDLVTVIDGGVEPATDQRKRAIQLLVTLLCTPRRKPSCFTDRCLRRFLDRIQETIKNRVPNVPILFQILSGNTTRNASFTLELPLFFTTGESMTKVNLVRQLSF